MHDTVHGDGVARRLSELCFNITEKGAGGSEAGSRAALPIFVCIGTDRSTGDAFGPLVGTLLEEAGYPDVIGTLDHPCDSSNLRERVSGLATHRMVIAFDSCVGPSTGRFRVSPSPLEPGKSMGKPLPPVGRISVLAVVAPNRDNPYKVLQTASLGLVFKMAKQAAAAVLSVFPLEGRGA